jgi:regulatory protein
MEKSQFYQKSIEYCFSLLAKKRYTKQEMGKKLRLYAKRRSFELEEVKEDIGAVVDRLVALKYLDDIMFARDFISDRMRFKPRGRFMIEQELWKKGIAKEDFAEVFRDLEFDELAMAITLIEKKERAWRDLEGRKKKDKAFRFLASKGFSPEIVYKTVKHCYDRVIE